jgi:hypothetical protein
MIFDTNWPKLRRMQGEPHIFFVWPQWQQPLKSLEGRNELMVSDLPDLKFNINGRKYIPVSRKINQPIYHHNLNEALYRKFYILILPLIDNHDMFSKVARVTVHNREHCVYTRTLKYPGDMDYFDPHQDGIGGTVRGRKTRYGLLPLLTSEQGDWEQAKPPVFPQPEYWSRSIPIILESGTLSVIECDLSQPVRADMLSFECLGEYAAFGILGITAETIPDSSKRTVFDSQKENALEGWQMEGEAFSLASFPALFDKPTLNSLAAKGETAVGKAISPIFAFVDNDVFMTIDFQGGISKKINNQSILAIRLINADTNEILIEIDSPNSHVLTKKDIDIQKWRNKKVRLVLIDNNTDSSYAWIGLKSITIKSADNK